MTSALVTTTRQPIEKRFRKPHTVDFLGKLIRNTRFIEALDGIANCHKTSGDQPKSMVLAGESGSGKSTVIQHYLESFPVQEITSGRICPVLYVALEERTNVKGILSVLLEACGDPRPYSGSEREMNFRLRNYTKKMHVELIVIDEIQHVLPEHGVQRTAEAADLLKTLISKTGIPIVMVGLPATQRIITLMMKKDGPERQLERRLRRPYYLSAEQYGSTRWKNLITHYQKKLGVPCINLHTEEMLKRMYVASNGLHGFISKLLEEALELSDGIKQIDKTLLAQAYFEATSVKRLPNNPFDCEMRYVEDYLVSAIGRHEANINTWDSMLQGES